MGFLGSGFYSLVVIFAPMFIFKIGSFNMWQVVVYGISVIFLLFFLRPILKKVLGLYQYNPKIMGGDEAQGRANLGEDEIGGLTRFVKAFFELMDKRRVKSDPEYVRRTLANSENFKAIQESLKDVTPNYRTKEKINLAFSPFTLIWLLVGKLRSQRRGN